MACCGGGRRTGSGVRINTNSGAAPSSQTIKRVMSAGLPTPKQGTRTTV